MHEVTTGFCAIQTAAPVVGEDRYFDAKCQQLMADAPADTAGEGCFNNDMLLDGQDPAERARYQCVLLCPATTANKAVALNLYTSGGLDKLARNRGSGGVIDWKVTSDAGMTCGCLAGRGEDSGPDVFNQVKVDKEWLVMVAGSMMTVCMPPGSVDDGYPDYYVHPLLRNWGDGKTLYILCLVFSFVSLVTAIGVSWHFFAPRFSSWLRFSPSSFTQAVPQDSFFICPLPPRNCWHLEPQKTKTRVFSSMSSKRPPPHSPPGTRSTRTLPLR